MLAVKRVLDRLVEIKTKLNGEMTDIVGACAPQGNATWKKKQILGSKLHQGLQSISDKERLVIRTDQKRPVCEGSRGDKVMGSD